MDVDVQIVSKSHMFMDGDDSIKFLSILAYNMCCEIQMIKYCHILFDNIREGKKVSD